MESLNKLNRLKNQEPLVQEVRDALEELTNDYSELLKHVAELEKTASNVERYSSTIKNLHKLIRSVFILLNTDSPEDLQKVKDTLRSYVLDVANAIE